MRDFKSLLASALARRIAYVLIAAALAWCGIGESKAQSSQQCAYPAGGWKTCDQGMAFQECSAALARARAVLVGNTGGSIGDACPTVTGVNYVGFRCRYRTYAAGSFVQCPGMSSALSAAPLEMKCESRPDWNGPYPYLSGGIPKNGSVTCNAGCQQAWYSTGDGYFNGKYTSVPGTCGDMDDNQCKAKFGSAYYWNAAMSACEPEEQKCPGGAAANSLGKCEPEPCPEGMTQQSDGTCKKKESECPAGNIRSPDGSCLPGEGQCAKGETRGKDGTCKKDADEDGEPDEPGEGEGGEKPPNEFSGGDDCSRPPSCSGDAIMCGMARIQWRIDCNTRKNRNVAGGMCNAMPVCTGEKCDAVEHTQMIMQWRTACAVEKLASSGLGGGGGGDPETGIKDHMTALKNAEVTGLRAMSKDDGHAGVTEESIWAKPGTGEGQVTENMFGGGGGQCSIAFSIMGHAVEPGPDFYRIAFFIRWIMIASAYLWIAFKISE